MNSGTVSHTATQARLIIIIFFVCLFVFFVRILQEYLCFRELHYIDHNTSNFY